jgi:hypothetical protein
MKNLALTIISVFFLAALFNLAYAYNGYELWVKYDPVSNKQMLQEYKFRFTGKVGRIENCGPARSAGKRMVEK